MLSERQVQLWWVDPSTVQVDAPELLRWLTAEELERGRQRAIPHVRREFQVARALVRRSLSAQLPVPEYAWRFTSGEHDRPLVDAPDRRLHFSLTHTHGLVGCAVSHHEMLGLDVEPLERPAPLEIASRFFAPKEIDALFALPEADRHERFFALWTLKESYIKARSKGLSLPLDQFAITVSATPTIAFGPRIDDRPERWTFRQLRPTDRHLAALAVFDAPDLELLEAWPDLTA